MVARWRRSGALAGAALLAVGCSAGSRSQSPDVARTEIGVILPDSTSSARWESHDRVLLEREIRRAGFEPVIENAAGDPAAFGRIADELIERKVAVLMITAIDSESGSAVLQRARAAGIATVDYDRLTLGGGADVHVSFDNVTVGRLQGDGLIRCLVERGVPTPRVAVLNGSPTDNNATLFKAGYDSRIDPKFASGEWIEVGDRSVPDWDAAQAGPIFEQILAGAGGRLDGVLAANDGLAGAAIAVLRAGGLRVPVTGQDATVAGLRNILTGDQCMTVYKAIDEEAAAAAAAAAALARGEDPAVNGTVADSRTGREVPAVLEVPRAIFLADVASVVADGFVDASELCEGLQPQCRDAGIG